MSESFNPESISDEILSAFLDGELSREARIKVERWLEGSASARQRLADLRRISNWVQELPRAELPTEFAAQVMQQAERRMLLPQSTVAHGSASRWRKVRFWTMSVGLPAAACLFVAIMWRPQQAPQHAGNGAAFEAGRSVVAPPSGIASARDAVARPVTDGSVDSRVAETDRSPSGVGSAAALTTDGSKSASPADVGVAELSRQLDPAQVAVVVARIREISDQGRLPVVRFTVVDRKEGLELVQLALESKEISRESQAADKSKSPAALAPAASDSNREALFVVTDVEKLSEAFKALCTKQETLVAWKIDEPIELARFDGRSQQRIEQAMQDLRKAGEAKAAVAIAARSPRGPGASAGSPRVKTTAKTPGLPGRTTSSTETTTNDDEETRSKIMANIESLKARVAEPADRQLVVTLADSPPVAVEKTSAAKSTAAAASSLRNAKPGVPTRAVTRDGKATQVQVLLVVEPAPAKVKTDEGGAA